MPLSSFTLLFSELTTDPCLVSAVVESVRFEIPTTPWVCPVMGPRVLAPAFVSDGALPPVATEGLGGGVEPPMPELLAVPPPAAVPPGGAEAG